MKLVKQCYFGLCSDLPIKTLVQRQQRLSLYCLFAGFFNCENISVKDFFSECKQICSFLQICSYLLKESVTENFIFYTVKIIMFRSLTKAMNGS